MSNRLKSRDERLRRERSPRRGSGYSGNRPKLTKAQRKVVRESRRRNR
jgi:hypothetical protein